MRTSRVRKTNYTTEDITQRHIGTGERERTRGRPVDEFTGVIAAPTKRVPPAKKRIRRQSGAKKVTALLQIALPAEHMRACPCRIIIIYASERLIINLHAVTTIVNSSRYYSGMPSARV